MSHTSNSARSRLVALVLVLAATLAAGAENTAATPVSRDNPKWMAKHEAINDRIKQGNVDLLWIGDSIVEHWTGVGKDTWDKYYAPRHAANLGISGDNTEHVLWRLQHGNIDGIHPKLAIVMIGQNNGPHNTAEEIAEGVTDIVSLLRAKFPDMKILLLAIFFRGEHPNEEQPRLAKASELASKIADNEHVFYMDINKFYLAPNGDIPKELFPDYEHPSPKGHQLWAETIEPTVAKLFGDAPVKP